MGENTQSSKSAQSLNSISTKIASPTRKMKFPITVTYRQLEAKIYRNQIGGVKYYKAAYRAKGGRITKNFHPTVKTFVPALQIKGFLLQKSLFRML